jgi:AAHS family 4-hydroxybenzoate transporter-like MFS transporter
VSAAAPASTDIRTLLDRAPMSRAQIIGVLVVGALSALDGYDVLAISFAGPGISKGWGLGPTGLGLVFSSGLAGMGLGALFLAPFADTLGRRALIFITLGLMSAGMLCSAFAGSIGMLAACRVLTGIGIGAMVPVINPLSAEYPNAKRRALGVAVMAIGYPIGGTLGGFAAAWLLSLYGWPAVFLLGAAVALLMFPVVHFWLPESPAFLLERRGGNSLAKLNALLARFGHAPVDQLPNASGLAIVPYAEIFAAGQRGRTLWIAAVNFLFVITVYYILSWMPQLATARGLSPSEGTMISAICNGAGVAAGLTVGLLAARMSVRWLAAALMVGLGITTFLFGNAPAGFGTLAVMAALAGICLFGAVSGLYGTVAASFPARIRATGAGFVTGLGRGGSALAPFLAGALFSLGAGRGGVSLAMGAAAALGGLILLLPIGKSAGRV